MKKWGLFSFRFWCGWKRWCLVNFRFYDNLKRWWFFFFFVIDYLKRWYFVSLKRWWCFSYILTSTPSLVRETEVVGKVVEQSKTSFSFVLTRKAAWGLLFTKLVFPSARKKRASISQNRRTSRIAFTYCEKNSWKILTNHTYRICLSFRIKTN